MGLGAAHRDSIAAAGKSLTAARDAADRARKLLQSGVDPIDAKALERQRQRKVLVDKKAARKQERSTLARVARAYHERVIEGSRGAKHAAQWIASLESNVPEDLWQKPIVEITGPELLSALIDLQASASRNSHDSARGERYSECSAIPSAQHPTADDQQ
jgi:integrase-like protein